MRIPSPGQRLGPYELISAIGAGGMGEVWKARDTRLDRTLAIKFLRIEFHERMEREAQAIAALNHPNICQIYDVGEDYLVMEYVDGQPVRCPGSVRKLLDISVQIADGLAAAHSARIVHRDLKPDNILDTREGQIKILDFGLAKQKETSAQDESTRLLTRPGAVMGTIRYMSPEQASGQPLDFRSDQFSFGIVLYELISDKLPFSGNSAAETIAAIIRDEPEPLPVTVPLPLRWVVERCLAKDPAQRYDSTRDLYRELRQIRDRLSEAQSSGMFAAAPAAPAARRSRALPMALVACACLAAFAFWRLASVPWKPDLANYRFSPFANESYVEESPVWSPDGRSIAYVAQAGAVWKLMVKGIDDPSPVTLVTSENSLDNISWFPDGGSLSFDLEHAVFSVSLAGGEPKPLTSGLTVTSSALSPDGHSLALSVDEHTAVKKSRSLLISSPPGASPRKIGAFHPDCCVVPDWIAWSADSTRLLAMTTAEGIGTRLWEVPLSGAPRIVLESPLIGDPPRISWAPGTRYALLPSQLSFENLHLGLNLIDPASGRAIPLFPTTEAVSSAAFSPDGKAIAYSIGGEHFSLVEIPLDASAPLHPVSTSRLDEGDGAWSRTSIYAYVRGLELRIRNREGTLDRLVVSPKNFPLANAIQPSSPAFSPDGDRIAYFCSFSGGGYRSGAWISPVNGGPPASISDHELAYPAWSPDASWIAAADITTPGLVKVRIGGGRIVPIRANLGCNGVAWSPDGQWIGCGAHGGALLLVSPDGTKVRSLGKGYSGMLAWSPDSRGLYTIRGDSAQRFGFVDAATGKFREIRQMPADFFFDVPSWSPRFSLSPDAKSVLASQGVASGDIWILRGFESPPDLWRRILGF